MLTPTFPPPTPNPRQLLVPLTAIQSFTLLSLAPAATSGAPGKVPPAVAAAAPPPADPSQAAHRLRAAVARVRADEARRGKGVSREAQDIFDALARTLPARWDGESIVVLDAVVITKPYRSEDCRAAKGVQPQMLQRVRKVVSGRRKTCLADTGQETLMREIARIGEEEDCGEGGWRAGCGAVEGRLGLRRGRRRDACLSSETFEMIPETDLHREALDFRGHWEVVSTADNASGSLLSAEASVANLWHRGTKHLHSSMPRMASCAQAQLHIQTSQNFALISSRNLGYSQSRLPRMLARTLPITPSPDLCADALDRRPLEASLRPLLPLPQNRPPSLLGPRLLLRPLRLRHVRPVASSES